MVTGSQSRVWSGPDTKERMRKRGRVDPGKFKYKGGNMGYIASLSTALPWIDKFNTLCTYCNPNAKPCDEDMFQQIYHINSGTCTLIAGWVTHGPPTLASACHQWMGFTGISYIQWLSLVKLELKWPLMTWAICGSPMLVSVGMLSILC